MDASFTSHSTGVLLPDQVAQVKALEKVSREPEVVRSMESRGADVGFLNAQLMGAFMSADATKWKRVVSFAKITSG